MVVVGGGDEAKHRNDSIRIILYSVGQRCKPFSCFINWEGGGGERGEGSGHSY